VSTSILQRFASYISNRLPQALPDLSTSCAHGIIRSLIPELMTLPLAVPGIAARREPWATAALQFDARTLAASGTPSCCAAVLRCTPLSTPRFLSAPRIDSRTNLHSSINPKTSRKLSQTHSAPAVPAQYAPTRSSAPAPTPENATT